MTNSMSELRHADCILVTGSNTTEAHPIIALDIKAAVEKYGAKLIVADPRKIGLVAFPPYGSGSSRVRMWPCLTV